jgi:hypothetical protein
MADAQKLNLTDLSVDIPDDIGLEGYNEESLGGEMHPPQPGIYCFLAEFPAKKAEELIKLDVTADGKPRLSAMVNFTIVDAEDPIDEDETAWRGKKVFNQYMSTQIMKGQSTSFWTDFLKASGADEAELAKIKLAGGLTVARNLMIEQVANQAPVWGVLAYGWQGESQREDPKNPGKPIYVQYKKDTIFSKVPNSMKGLSKDAEGKWPTEREFELTWEDGEKETIILKARPKVQRFVLPRS